MFVTRLLTVAISLPFVIAALLFLPQQLWALVMFPVLAIASWEWAGLAGYTPAARRRMRHSSVFRRSRSSIWPAACSLRRHVDIGIYALSCVFWLAIAPVWLVERWATRNPLLLALVGWIALVPMWLALVRLQATPWLLLLILSIVWIADTAAYLTGKRWGRRKLAPLISPGKTWEGALGAAAAVAIYYGAFLLFTRGAGRALFRRLDRPRCFLRRPRAERRRRSLRIVDETAGGRERQRAASARARRHPRPHRRSDRDHARGGVCVLPALSGRSNGVTTVLTILGSTGSVGANTLDVVERHPGRFRVVALTAHAQGAVLLEQCGATVRVTP